MRTRFQISNVSVCLPGGASYHVRNEHVMVVYPKRGQKVTFASLIFNAYTRFFDERWAQWYDAMASLRVRMTGFGSEHRHAELPYE